MDACEHFVKQSYRSRCPIYGPNGKQDLIIPIVHDKLYEIPIKEVRIANDYRWQIVHWRSLEAAFKNSPYFEFYEDAFRPYYEKKYNFLFDFNLELINELFKAKRATVEIKFTEKYEPTIEDASDLRNYFHPKKNYETPEKYHQVFSDKHGFIERLSVVDLLFNTGK